MTKKTDKLFKRIDSYLDACRVLPDQMQVSRDAYEAIRAHYVGKRGHGKRQREWDETHRGVKIVVFGE